MALMIVDFDWRMEPRSRLCSPDTRQARQMPGIFPISTRS